MLRRPLGLFLALCLIASPALSSYSLETYAQDGSPVAVETSEPDSAGSQLAVDSDIGSDTVQPASEPGNTWAGSNVGPIFPLPDVYLTFGLVDIGGETTAAELDSSSVPPLLDGYRIDNARIVRIETIATFQYNVTVCVIYDGANFVDPASIRLLRLTGAGWVLTDVEGGTAAGSSTVCGYTPALGIFAAAELGNAPTPEPADTETPLPTATAIATRTATATIVPTQTETLIPTQTATVTNTNTPIPSGTSTPPATATNSPSPTTTSSVTATNSPNPSATANSTATNSPSPSATASSTASNSPSPSATTSSTATATASRTATQFSTSTSTNSPTNSPTATPTATSTSTSTSIATSTATSTYTATTSPNASATFTATPTSATGQTQYALPNVWVNYSDPPSSGTTSGVVLDGSALPPLPSQYRVVNAWFFSISTSVTLTTNKQICVLFEASHFDVPASVTLLRNTGSSWTALTGLFFPSLDANQGTICGYTSSLGAFALAERLPATAVPSFTPSRTATATSTPSNTATTPPTWTPTASSTPTKTTTATSTATSVVSPTSSATPTATQSPTSSPSPTSTATSTHTNTATATPTSTATLGPGSYPTGAVLRTSNRVNLRSGAGTTYSSLGVVASGASVTVTGPSTAAGGYIWVPVNVPSIGNGWIAGNYLKAIPTPTPTRTPVLPTVTKTPGGSTATTTRTPDGSVATGTATRPPGGFIAGDFVRTTTRVNLRSGPTTSAQVLTVLPTNSIGEVTGPGVRSGSTVFYPVVFAGQPGGYLAGSYLRSVAATPTATRTLTPSPTFAGNPIRVTTSNVNMRSGAGSGYRIVATLPKGTRVSITGAPKRSGGYDWYPVAVNGIGSGWVAGKFLSINPPV